MTTQRKIFITERKYKQVNNYRGIIATTEYDNALDLAIAGNLNEVLVNFGLDIEEAIVRPEFFSPVYLLDQQIAKGWEHGIDEALSHSIVNLIYFVSNLDATPEIDDCLKRIAVYKNCDSSDHELEQYRDWIKQMVAIVPHRFLTEEETIRYVEANPA